MNKNVYQINHVAALKDSKKESLRRETAGQKKREKGKVTI
jgi:hypothetical protein